MRDWQHTVTVLGLVALAVLAHYVGAAELALTVVGGALGYMAPRGSPGARARTLGGAVALVVGASLLSGCGASALQQHRTIASIAVVAEQGASRALDAGREHGAAACAGDSACIERTAEHWRPAETARAVVGPLVRAYHDAVAVGTDDPACIGALGVALARLLEGWAEVVRRADGVGVVLPDLPGGRH